MGMTEDEMAGWHHGLDGHESEWTLGDGDGQGGLACCDSWGRKESDTTEWLDWTELNWFYTGSSGRYGELFIVFLYYRFDVCSSVFFPKLVEQSHLLSPPFLISLARSLFFFIDLIKEPAISFSVIFPFSVVLTYALLIFFLLLLFFWFLEVRT